MELVKTFADIRKGDTVRLLLGKPTWEVLEVDADACGIMKRLRLSREHVEQWFTDVADSPVILVHRPWSEEETEASMKALVASCARRVTAVLGNALYSGPEQARAVANLREALDAYELGKPPARMKEPSDDFDPRVDESSGYLGGGPV